MSGDLEVRRKRAGFRANHRGTKEMDWLLGRFADATVPGMSHEDVLQFERFVAISDPELHSWILTPELCSDAQFTDLLQRIRAFHGLVE